MKQEINNGSTGIRELRKLQRIVDDLRKMNEQYEEVSYNATSELSHIIRVAKEMKMRSEKLRKKRKREREKQKRKVNS